MNSSNYEKDKYNISYYSSVRSTSKSTNNQKPQISQNGNARKEGNTTYYTIATFHTTQPKVQVEFVNQQPINYQTYSSVATGYVADNKQDDVVEDNIPICNPQVEVLPKEEDANIEQEVSKSHAVTNDAKFGYFSALNKTLFSLILMVAATCLTYYYMLENELDISMVVLFIVPTVIALRLFISLSKVVAGLLNILYSIGAGVIIGLTSYYLDLDYYAPELSIVAVVIPFVVLLLMCYLKIYNKKFQLLRFLIATIWTLIIIYLGITYLDLYHNNLNVVDQILNNKVEMIVVPSAFLALSTIVLMGDFHKIISYYEKFDKKYKEWIAVSNLITYVVLIVILVFLVNKIFNLQ